jgi:hypothetical protein
VPIDAVQITIVSTDPAAPLRKTVFTNARGEASIDDALGLALRVDVSAPGFAAYTEDVDPSKTALEVVLRPAESATGDVRDRRGYRLPRADVTLQTAIETKRTRTDKDGVFTFAGLSEGKATVRVRAPEHAPLEREVAILDKDGDRPTDLGRFELVQEAIAEGVVVDESGQPVPGARVALGMVPTYVAQGASSAPATTNVKGEFAVRELPAGDEALSAYHAELGRGQIGVHLEAGSKTRDLRIVLHAEPGAGKGALVRSSVAVTLGETASPHEVLLAAVAEGSEAERAGLRAGDVLLEVDGKPVQSIDEARARLNGPASVDAVLKIRRPSSEPSAGQSPAEDRDFRIRVRRERVQK